MGGFIQECEVRGHGLKRHDAPPISETAQSPAELTGVGPDVENAIDAVVPERSLQRQIEGSKLWRSDAAYAIAPPPQLPVHPSTAQDSLRDGACHASDHAHK